MTLPDNSPRFRPRLFASAAGFACACLGLLVLIGWHTHNTALLRVYPTFVAMAYNTALGFLLCGLGVSALGLGRPKVAMVLGGLTFLIGALSLAEYLSGRNLGVDQLIIKAYIRSGIVNYGRMSFATALCFALGGAALLLFRFLPSGPRLGLTGLCGSLITGLGVTALSGYFTGVINAYAWGQLTRMAVHTAAGFIVLGSGLAAAVWRESTETESAPRWLPFLVGVAAVTLTVCIWQALIIQQGTEEAVLTRLAARAGLSVTGIGHTRTLIAYGALVSGLLMSGLLAVAVALTQTAQRRARELDAANRALAQTQAGLEARVAERTDELSRANRALREVLASVSEGRFRLCEDVQDLPPALTPVGSPVALDRGQGLHDLRHQALEAGRQLGIHGERSHDLVTAVGEAAMNAVTHGGGGEGRVHLSPNGTVQVWVRDSGAGIALEHLPRATLERGYTTAGTLGHGFWLMLTVIDRLWLLTGPTGTTVVLEQDRNALEPAWLRTTSAGEGTLSAA